jgi:hypothetical protein
MKKFLFPVSLIFLVLLLAGWGSKGHRKISQNSAFCLPAGMYFLTPAWTNFVTSHASDADYRKDQDPDESPRHYIDIDNYPEFLQDGFIHPSYDTALGRHGYSFVIDQGILPWATLRSYDSLKSCFQRRDWNRSSLFAADLGHYVADGHMPLHITRNYNGQMTGQTGIHSRYETSMISRYESQLVYPVDSAVYVPDVTAYIFSYLYLNYTFVDSLLAADSFAFLSAGNINSTAYYEALWAKSRHFTIGLMRHGSHALSSLIYTAWVEAGSPVMYPNAISEPETPGQPLLLPIYPNPASEIVYFPVVINDHSTDFTLEIYDMAGNLKDTIIRKSTADGMNKISWETTGVASGTYLCVLKSGNRQATRKFVVAH